MNKFCIACVFACLFGIFGLSSVQAQSVGINTSGATPHASAILDVSSESKGVLIPRMNQAQRDAIVSPATGLMIYQVNNTPGFYYFNGSAWAAVGGSSNAGAQVALFATKTSNAQVLPLGNGVNTGDLVTFNNVITSNATLGTYNTSTNTFTVSQAGVYYIQATTRTPDASTASTTTNQFLFVDIDNAGITGVNNIITDYQAANPGNFPSGVKGKGFTSVMFFLNAGQTINIKGLTANSSTISQPLKTDGSCQFLIVKL